MKAESCINIIRADYIASAVRRDQYPERVLPEIAFIGRSNVGKSSLLNSLVRRRGLARISGSPGKTQTLNYYCATAKIDDERREDFYLVDLPGYGYARTGRVSRRQWSKFTEEYLLNSPQLQLICQLIDIRHPPQNSDILAYRWLMANGLPVQVVATKADKIGKMATNKHIQIIKTGLGMKDNNIIIHSSVSGMGRAELLDAIEYILLK